MKVSIVTPSYNQAQYIERTIKSVLDQNHKDIEYIVIDGGSTDGTVDILKKYSDRIIWKSEKDNGQSDAINKGLRIATGDIVAYLNSDDTYAPGAITKIVNFFKNNPEAKWVSGKCKIINEKDEKIRNSITKYKNFWLRLINYFWLLVLNPISQPSTFWKRELHNEIGYFSERKHLAMDYDFWLRICRKYKFNYLPSYLANFRWHIQSKGGVIYLEQFKEEYEIAKKYAKENRQYFPIFLHKINEWLIILSYKILKG
jgi:glycosyltransferase involved in cell wall biosynthesis